MLYLELLWSFLQIGLFSIGGGYAALPLIQNQVVNLHGWLTMTEFTDVVTIAEMTPGPISINAATFVGTRLAGFPGALIATFGCILPSCVIVLTLSVLYRKYRTLQAVDGILAGLRPAVVGMIAAAGASIVLMALWQGGSVSLQPDWAAVVLIAAGLFWLRKFRPSPIAVMLAAGAAGGVFYRLFA